MTEAQFSQAVSELVQGARLRAQAFAAAAVEVERGCLFLDIAAGSRPCCCDRHVEAFRGIAPRRP